MRKKNKKAVVEIQFSWIFILIAGSVILLFFVNVAGKYKSSQEDALASDILVRLSAIISAGQMSANSNILLDLPKNEIEVMCFPETCEKKGCDTIFDFKKSSISPPAWMDIEPIFSSSFMKDDQLITWSLDWFTPFKATSVLYLSTINQKYVLVYDTFPMSGSSVISQDFTEFLKERLDQNNFTNFDYVEFDNLESYEYSGELSTRFIFLNAAPVNEIDLHSSFDRNSRISALKITDLDDNYEGNTFGEFKFCNYDDDEFNCPDDDEIEFFGLPMFFGGLFSDNIDNYKCNRIKMFLKLEHVIEMYSEKADSISYSGCNYNSIKSDIDDFESSFSFNLGVLNVDSDFNDKIIGISDKNNQLQISDCPLVY